MGDVVTGKYSFSLSSWVITRERKEVSDIVPMVTGRLICLLIPEPPSFDPGLLIRPFSNKLWHGIGMLLLVGSFFTLLPRIFIDEYDNMTSNQITMFALWTFFVLINAYYGGALTMFFVAENTIPFYSVRDVLKEFPDWKLIFQSGIGSEFKQQALNVSIAIHVRH